MSGFELRIWRRGMSWDQERAAEELGVSLRSYKRYEKAREVARLGSAWKKESILR